MKNRFRILAASAIIAVAMLVAACSPPTVSNAGGDNAKPAVLGESGDGASDPSGDSASVKTFTLTGENFKFVMGGVDNPDLKVKVGDTVRIEFTSKQGFHDWVVDEFNAATAQVRAVNSTSVEFVADKAGTFEYYCSVGSHRQQGMKGNLIVE